MIVLQNLHTHTTYCDGIDTPEQVVQQAISLGMDSIGFSEHSPLFYSPLYNDIKEKNKRYREEIRRLKDAYRGKIHILCGLEVDLYSAKDQEPSYDYLIGSVHYLHIGNEYVGFDRDSATVERVINTYFKGNGLAYAKAYYEALGEMPTLMSADIIGHFDLITKHAEKVTLFDTEDPVYRAYATDAMDVLVKKVPVLEINTGAVARGYRTAVYPDPFLLKEWKKRGGEIIISSDCHDKRNLLCAFGDAVALARECGFDHSLVLDVHGFCEVSLDELEKKLSSPNF